MLVQKQSLAHFSFNVSESNWVNHLRYKTSPPPLQIGSRCYRFIPKWTADKHCSSRRWIWDFSWIVTFMFTPPMKDRVWCFWETCLNDAGGARITPYSFQYSPFNTFHHACIYFARFNPNRCRKQKNCCLDLLQYNREIQWHYPEKKYRFSCDSQMHFNSRSDMSRGSSIPQETAVRRTEPWLTVTSLCI